MSCFLPALIFASAVAPGLGGCRVATEYVPQTPGRATIGVERGAVGVYKNGTFTRLYGPVSDVFGCSASATTAVAAAASHDASYRHTSLISSGAYGLMWLVPPLVFAAVGFGVVANSEREGAFAFTVDAVNMHNDTTACIAPAPAVGARQ